MTLRLSLTAALLATAATAPVAAQDAPIVLPGAPGEASRTIDAREAIAITGVSYAPGDVRFMQDMIQHRTVEPGQFLFIKQVLMYLMIAITLPIFSHWPNQDLFTRG